MSTKPGHSVATDTVEPQQGEQMNQTQNRTGTPAGALLLPLLAVPVALTSFGLIAGVTTMTVVMGYVLAVTDFSTYAAHERSWTTKVVSNFVVIAMGVPVFYFIGPLTSWITGGTSVMRFPGWALIAVGSMAAAYLLISLALIPAVRKRSARAQA